MFNFKIKKKLKVFVPSTIIENKTECDLYGFYVKETNIFNVVSSTPQRGLRKLGFISTKDKINDKNLCGYFENNDLIFIYKKDKYSVESYSLIQNIFSRNKGILETDKMINKRVIIVGCGSVGSLIALELARSGVGNFMLIDTDIMEYHNVCRHQCGISDVGEYKVIALKKRILNINPLAKIIVKVSFIENVKQKDFNDFCNNYTSIFVGAADNRKADIYTNRLSAKMNSAFISIGLWERAVVGEIFYWLPNRNLPCYQCAIGVENTARVEVNNHHVYSSQVDIEKVKFEPGISIDINFVTNIGIKLIIDMLNKSDKNYIVRLLNQLQQYTLICNTSNPEIGGKIVEIFSYPLQVTKSIYVNFGKNCKDKKVCIHE